MGRMYFTVEPAQHRLPFYKTLLCVTCALILIVNGFSLFQNLQSLKGANEQLATSARITERLQYLNVLVLDADSSARGYFISGNEIYLGPTRTVVAGTETEFRELEKLLADNAPQLKNLAHLQTLVRRRLAIIGQTIDVYRQGGLDDVVNISRYSDERGSMDEIRLQVVIMVREQGEASAARSAMFYREYQKAVIMGAGINAIAIIVLIMFYQLVRRSFVHRAAVEHQLQLSNESLESQVAKRTEQLSVLSRHLISISEDEKKRLSRELHDEMGANLTSIAMDITAVRQKLKDTHPELVEQLGRARATLIDTVELKRRIIENLRPSLLDNLGLPAAIDSYCEEFARLSSMPVDTEIGPEVDGIAKAGEATLSIALFRIVQESLTNIRKYARASRVSVSLRRNNEQLVLRIIDDGVGIEANTLAKPMSHGLLGMRERALLLGGTLNIRRGRGDRGTCIEVFIPLKSGAPAGEKSVSSKLHQRAGDHTPFSPPYSTHPRSVPDLHDQAR